MTGQTFPNWAEMAITPRNWVKSDLQSICQVGHLTGYLSWGGEVLTYGIMGVSAQQWDLKNAISGEARLNGVEDWARQKVEAMIAWTIAQFLAA